MTLVDWVKAEAKREALRQAQEDRVTREVNEIMRTMKFKPA